MFARLGRWCYRRRWIVVIAWIVTLVVGFATLSAVGTASRSDFDLPNVESRRGSDILEEHFGGFGAGFGGSVVFRAEQGVDDPTVRSAMSEAFDDIAQLGGLEITSPYSPDGARQIAAQGTEAGKVAYASIELPSDITGEEATAPRTRRPRCRRTATGSAC